MIERAGAPSPGAPSCASASIVASGPTPQFTPIASTPAAVSASTAAAGRRPVREHEVLAERHRGDHRDVGCGPCLVHGEQQVPEVEERLDDEQVDAALEQAVDLLPERGPDRRLVGVAELARRRSQRPDRPADPGVPAAHVAGLACDLRRPAVDAPGLGRQPVPVEPDPVRAERQRLDEIGARVEVLAVERRHEVGPARRELVEARPLRDAAREQERAHPAVREQRRGGEASGELVAGKAHGRKPTGSSVHSTLALDGRLAHARRTPEV